MNTDPTRASAEARLAAMGELVESGRTPTEAELGALRDDLADERKLVQRRAAEAFAALADRGVGAEEVLRAALAAPTWRVRWGATYAFALIGVVPEGALETALEGMGCADGDLRWAATDIMSKFAAIDRPAAIDRLVDLVESGTPGQRKMALYCLRDLDAREALAATFRALADRCVDVRLAGLSALVRLGRSSAAAATRIATLVDDADPRLQRAAAATLGSVGVSNPEVLSVLHRAEHSADPSLRRAAARSLRVLAAPAAPGREENRRQ